MSVSQKAHDAQVHALLERLVPALEPPSGDLPDPERLAALVEGRLAPRESAELVELIRKSGAARVELRSLYPERYRALMGEVAPSVPASVLRFPARRWWAGATALAVAAAAALVLWLPAQPPAGGGAELQARSESVRGNGTAEPGDRFHLLMRLGRPSLVERLRGHGPWGALFQADKHGARLVCTSADARCRTAGETLSWSFVAPLEAGTTAFVFVTAGREPSREQLATLLDQLPGQVTSPGALGDVLERWAADAHGQVHRLNPVEVR